MVLSVLSLLSASLIPELLSEVIYSYVIEIAINLVFALWGIQYFSSSRRIANTFHNKKIFERELYTEEEIINKVSFLNTINSEFESKKIIKNNAFEDYSNKQVNMQAIKRKNKIKVLSMISAIVVSAGVIIGLGTSYTKLGKYINANILYQLQKYDDALIIYKDLDDYKNSKEAVNQLIYKQGVDMFNRGDLEKSLETFKSIENYKNSTEFIEKIYPLLLDYYIKNDQFNEALKVIELLDYHRLDSSTRNKYNEVCVRAVEELIKNERYDEADEIIKSDFNLLRNSGEVRRRIEIVEREIETNRIGNEYDKAVELYNEGSYWSALGIFKKITGFKEDDFTFNVERDYKDSREYLILLTIMDLYLSSEDFADYASRIKYNLGDLYQQASSIKDFKDMETYLNEKIFYFIHLMGQFSGDGVYFEYNRNGEFDEEMKYNRPNYGYNSFKLKDNATLLQTGDGNTWIDTFEFSFDGHNILNVYSYKNGRTYRLIRNW